MRKILPFLLWLALLATPALAQYQTPGTGVRWTLPQLAAATGTNVVNTGPSTYSVNGNLRLSPRDTLVINTNVTLRLVSLAQFNVDGVMLVNPPDSVKITAQNSAAPFHSIWFSATSAGSSLRKTIVEYGGGIKVVGINLFIDSCVVRYQVARIGTVNTNSGAISLSGGAARISHCRLYANARAAILSPANIATSPVIQDCIIENNDTENGNYPQVNLGIGGATPIVVERCRITGRYNMAGGIAVSNLLGTTARSQVQIRRNYIANNRYGLALLGSNITAQVTRNVIENNNTNPNALTGGSGINLQGSATLTGVASRNVLRGNLWGVTMLRTSFTTTTPGPSMTFGDVSSPDTLNVGRNRLYNNGNGGQVYDFYVEMPDNVMAQNNDWNTNSAATIEAHVVHRVDQPALGLLNFQPFLTALAARPEAQPLAFDYYPNPAQGLLTLRLPGTGPATVRLCDNLDRELRQLTVLPVNGLLLVPTTGIAPGLYAITVKQAGRIASAKVAITE